MGPTRVSLVRCESCVAATALRGHSVCFQCVSRDHFSFTHQRNPCACCRSIPESGYRELRGRFELYTRVGVWPTSTQYRNAQKLRAGSDVSLPIETIAKPDEEGSMGGARPDPLSIQHEVSSPLSSPQYYRLTLDQSTGEGSLGSEVEEVSVVSRAEHDSKPESPPSNATPALSDLAIGVPERPSRGDAGSQIESLSIPQSTSVSRKLAVTTERDALPWNDSLPDFRSSAPDSSSNRTAGCLLAPVPNWNEGVASGPLSGTIHSSANVLHPPGAIRSRQTGNVLPPPGANRSLLVNENVLTDRPVSRPATEAERSSAPGAVAEAERSFSLTQSKLADIVRAAITATLPAQQQLD